MNVFEQEIIKKDLRTVNLMMSTRGTESIIPILNRMRDKQSKAFDDLFCDVCKECDKLTAHNFVKYLDHVNIDGGVVLMLCEHNNINMLKAICEKYKQEIKECDYDGEKFYKVIVDLIIGLIFACHNKKTEIKNLLREYGVRINYVCFKQFCDGLKFENPPNFEDCASTLMIKVFKELKKLNT
jgi:hypothetical protein